MWPLTLFIAVGFAVAFGNRAAHFPTKFAAVATAVGTYLHCTNHAYIM
eukprot:COSAG01_NODE_35133_length_536_cov_1.743707_1_plen_47_part_01